VPIDNLRQRLISKN